MAERLDLGIVGGGMLGLTMAYRMANRGHAVTVYEAAPEVGGLARSAALGDVTWDRFYHVTLQSDSALLALLHDLRLDGELEWHATGTGLYDDGNIYPVSSVVDYLRLPVLGPIAKGRIGATVLRAATTHDWRALERMTAEEWLTRWSGRRAYRRFWQPLLRAKLGDRHDQASAAFIWAIIQRLYAARRAGLKQDLFGYVRGGYATVLDALQRAARDSGVVIRTGAPVRSVSSGGGTVDVESVVDGSHDRVVITTPSPMAADLIHGLDPAEARQHRAIEYQGVVCVSLLVNTPLTDYYVTNITDPSVPFTGVIDMTALVDPATFGGRGLVYLPFYASPTDAIHDEDDASITERAIASFASMLPTFSSQRVVASSVGRARYVLPLSTVGYSDRLPPMRTSVDGVWVVNSAHIVNGTLNVQETIELSDRGVEAVLGEESRSVVP